MFPIVTVTCFLVRLENLGCGVHLTIALGVGWRAARVGVVVTGTCGFRVAGACDRVSCAIGWHLGADSRRGIFLLCCAGVLAGALGWCISGGMAVTSSCTACFSAMVCRSSHTALSLVSGRSWVSGYTGCWIAGSRVQESRVQFANKTIGIVLNKVLDAQNQKSAPGNVSPCTTKHANKFTTLLIQQRLYKNWAYDPDICAVSRGICPGIQRRYPGH